MRLYAVPLLQQQRQVTHLATRQLLPAVRMITPMLSGMDRVRRIFFSRWRSAGFSILREMPDWSEFGSSGWCSAGQAHAEVEQRRSLWC